MKKFTFENCQTIHKQLWNWLAETGKPHKPDWLEWKKITEEYGTTPIFFCPACEYAESIAGSGSKCRKCPIKRKGGGNCELSGAEFDEWRSSKGSGAELKRRKELARIIANKKWTDKK